MRKLLLWVLLIGLPLAVHANDEKCSRRTTVLEGDWEYVRSDEFIFAYTLTGPHSVGPGKALGDSGPPAVVVDAAAQLSVARRLLMKLGFQLPLESLRYRAQGASNILVRFQNIKANGLAFDEVSRFPSGECVLTMVLSNRYVTGGVTPVHEYFHLVQNGYAMFKRSWYYEGLARWAESSLARRDLHMRPPVGVSALESLWSESYSAETAWNSIIRACAPIAVAPDAYDFAADVRYSDGRQVVGDRTWLGVDFVRMFLEGLSRRSRLVSNEMNLPSTDWPEIVQRDTRFDPYIWQAVEEACSQSGGVLAPANPVSDSVAP